MSKVISIDGSLLGSPALPSTEDVAVAGRVGLKAVVEDIKPTLPEDRGIRKRLDEA